MQRVLADIVDISATIEAPCANWSSLEYIFRLVSSTQCTPIRLSLRPHCASEPKAI